MQQPEDDMANIEFETSEDVKVIPTFDSMGLREDLLRGIYAYGTYTFTLHFIVDLVLNLNLFFFSFMVNQDLRNLQLSNSEQLSQLSKGGM